MLHVTALLDTYSQTCLNQNQIQSQRKLTCLKMNLVLFSLQQNGHFDSFFQTTKLNVYSS